MSATSDTKPEDAHWENWDRDRLLKLVEKLPSMCRIGVSHHAERMHSVFRVGETRSVHLRFEDRDGEPRAVVLTEIYDSRHDLGSARRSWTLSIAYQAASNTLPQNWRC
jgi:hypothetical protein